MAAAITGAECGHQKPFTRPQRVGVPALESALADRPPMPRGARGLLLCGVLLFLPTATPAATAPAPAAEAEIERLKAGGTAVPGRVGVPPAGSGILPERSSATERTSSAKNSSAAEVRPGETPAPAGGTPTPPAPLPLPDFTVAEGYQIELWAQNPMLEKPTQMNWDAAGRLWVASATLYPQIAPGQVADDKIIILSDPARTGKATKSEVFARGLRMPTGVVPDLGSKKEDLGSKDRAARAEGKGGGELPKSYFLNPKYGCYVTQGTELLHIDPAGHRRVVLTGFAAEDAQHLSHTPRWGPDGRLYFNQGSSIHSHLDTPWGMVRLNSGGCLAYDPRTERTEVFAKGLGNSWGHAWDRWGQSFFTDAGGAGGISWVFPGATFAASEGARAVMPGIRPGAHPKFCGLEIIYSPHFPADWQGSAVTCDFHAHRVVRFGIEDLATGESAVSGRVGVPPAGSGVPPERTSDREPIPAKTAGALNPAEVRAGGTPTLPGTKSGYVTAALPDLVRTDDASFRPIDLKLGPDGALYVADWSNPIINHGEVDFRDPRRDHHSGRIWRISKKDTPPVKWEPLVGQKTPELLEKLLSENQWEKEQARITLTNRLNSSDDRLIPSPSVVKEIQGWRDLQKSDATNLAVLLLFNATAPVFESKGWAFYRHAQLVEALRSIQQPNAKAATIRLLAVSGSALADHDRRANKVENAYFGQGVQEMAEKKPLTIPKDSLAARILRKEVMMEELTEWNVAIRAESFSFDIQKLIADPNPRVRLEAMRALARIPTARSAELILDAAMKNNGDVFLNHAAWLSINELAKPWTDAIASGAWKSEGREAQLDFGLKALPPDLARDTLARVLADGKADLATGPWIELIGHCGGPADLRRIYEMLLVSYGTDCCPDPAIEALQAAAVNDATALRILAALLESARLRDVRPSGSLATLERLVLHTQEAVRAGSVRLVGYWKPAGALRWLETALADGQSPLNPAGVQNAIASAREIGGAPAIALLKKLAADGTPAPRRQQAAAALAALDLGGSLPEIAAAISAAPSEDAALAAWREVFKIKGAVEAVTARLSTEPWGRTLPPPARAALLRAAREAGDAGEGK